MITRRVTFVTSFPRSRVGMPGRDALRRVLPTPTTLHPDEHRRADANFRDVRVSPAEIDAERLDRALPRGAWERVAMRR